MRRSIIFYLAVSVLFATACSGPGNPDFGQSAGTGVIVGRAVYRGSDSHDGISIILEQTDGLNAASVVVSMGRPALARSVASVTATAGGGLYRFDGVAPGTYTIYAVSGNAKEKAVATNVTVGPGSLALADDLVLSLVGSLTGRIKVNGETGNAGVLVFIASTSYMAMTDSAGYFTISDVPVRSEGYQVVAMKGNYTTVLGTYTVTAGSIKDLGTKNLVIEGSGFIGIQWKGSLDSAPANPGVNWAYYDITQRKSFIWDGSAWRMIAQDGEPGTTGNNGQAVLPIVWKGALSSAPDNPEASWAYYDISKKASFIWDGNAWQTLSHDGFGTPIFMRVAELSSWLIEQGGGNTADDLIFAVYAGNETPGQLYDALDMAEKYVALDLSLSGITEFTPGDETGRKYIVTLNLPKECFFISGTSGDPVFKHFDSLASVTGGIKVSFGTNAFAGLTSLRSVNFPIIDASLGSMTFKDCINLSSVAIPRIVTLGYRAFEGCTSLVSISCPYLQTIGPEAFSGCTSLVSGNFPRTTYIQAKAFKDCTSLVSLALGESEIRLSSDVFPGTARDIRTITIYIPSDAYNMYAGKYRFGANSSADYFWDSDSPYRYNLTVVLGVIASQEL